jgi:two-component system nitrate/nitrite sensor histidine kinase NarX
LAQPENPELQASIQLFTRTLRALQYGGTTQAGTAAILSATGDSPSGVSDKVELPPAPDAELRGELDEATRLWNEFSLHLNPIDAPALQAASPPLLAQLDAIVSLFEARAEAKLRRVQAIQVASFAAAMVLLAWGYWLTRQRIFKPLLKLGAAARRMAGGELTKPVPRMGKDELGELARAFESMRREVATAQESLEGRVAQRTRELAAAFDLSQEIVSQLDLDHLLNSVTERARSLTGAKAAALCLLEADRSTLILSASSTEGEAWLNLRQPLHSDLSECVVGQGKTVTTPADCAVCAFLNSHAPGESAVAPLRAGEASLGALCVVREPGQPFDADESRALTLLANAAAIAITNARLAEEGRRQAEQAAIASERERLSAELHDNLAQTLSYLNLQIDQLHVNGDPQTVEKLNGMKSAVGGAYEQVRMALVGLSEPLPAAEDFAGKLAASLDEFQEISGLPVELEIADPSALALPRLAQAQALHIVREALANVHKHARAKRVRVRLESHDGLSRFIVEDDGCGFDPQAGVGGHHLGLRLMRARAERSGVILEVVSTPGEGTRIVAGFPLVEDDSRVTKSGAQETLDEG